MNLDFSQRVVKPDGVLIRELDGEAVILNLETETYFGLNEVGMRMWTLLTESESIQQAFDLLLNEYEIDKDRLRDDLITLLQQLLDNDLLMLRHG